MPACGCGKQKKEEKTISFDEFFEVMNKRITEERIFSKDVVFESNVSNVSCLFCPFVKDTGKN